MVGTDKENQNNGDEPQEASQDGQDGNQDGEDENQNPDQAAPDAGAGASGLNPKDLDFGQFASDDDNVVPLDFAVKSFEELAEENEALKDRLLRTLADSENLRRRAQREKADAAKYAISAFARDMLEVSDNLARALAAVLPEDIQAGGPHLATLFEGVEITEKGLQAAYDRHQIQLLSPAGEKFDPNFHQAVAEIPGTDKAHGTVVDVMQTGYLIGERLLRPAMVTVAKGEPVTPNQDQDEDPATPGKNIDTSA